jgi:hypothetical protein
VKLDILNRINALFMGDEDVTLYEGQLSGPSYGTNLLNVQGIVVKDVKKR